MFFIARTKKKKNNVILIHLYVKLFQWLFDYLLKSIIRTSSSFQVAILVQIIDALLSGGSINYPCGEGWGGR